MVEKITGYEFSSRFRKDYRALSKEIQETFEIKLPFFSTIPVILPSGSKDSSGPQIDGKVP
jgi:hypothetical protein